MTNPTETAQSQLREARLAAVMPEIAIFQKVMPQAQAHVTSVISGERERYETIVAGSSKALKDTKEKIREANSSGYNLMFITELTNLSQVQLLKSPAYQEVQRIIDDDIAKAKKRWTFLKNLPDNEYYEAKDMEKQRQNQQYPDMAETRAAVLQYTIPQDVRDNVTSFQNQSLVALEEAAKAIRDKTFDGAVSITLHSEVLDSALEVPTLEQFATKAGVHLDPLLPNIEKTAKMLFGEDFIVVGFDESQTGNNGFGELATVHEMGKVRLVLTKRTGAFYSMSWGSPILAYHSAIIKDEGLIIQEPPKEIVPDRIKILADGIVEAIKKAAQNEHGLSIVTTPLGYGKTTLLEALGTPLIKAGSNILTGKFGENGQELALKGFGNPFGDKTKWERNPILIENGKDKINIVIIDESPFTDPSSMPDIIRGLGTIRERDLGQNNLVIVLQPNKTPIPLEMIAQKDDYLVEIDPEVKTLRKETTLT